MTGPLLPAVGSKINYDGEIVEVEGWFRKTDGRDGGEFWQKQFTKITDPEEVEFIKLVNRKRADERYYIRVGDPKILSHSITEAIETYIEASDENIERAKQFLQQKWVEWSARKNPLLARDHPEYLPRDLSGCWFAGLFAKAVFGGVLRGHREHTYIVSHGKRIDLAADCAKVKALDQKGRAYRHHPKWLGLQTTNDNFREMLPHMQPWVQEFKSEIASNSF